MGVSGAVFRGIGHTAIEPRTALNNRDGVPVKLDCRTVRMEDELDVHTLRLYE